MNPKETPDNKNIKIKKPPVLFGKTQKLIQALEKQLGGKLIVYWNSFNGSVCHNDVVGLYELLRQMDSSKHLYIFIKSDGGTGTASLRIVHLLRQYAQHVTALIPLECMSAATMIALGADEIRMGPIARLSAVDTSLRHDLSPIDRDNARVSVSQNEVERILRSWENLADTNTNTHAFSELFKYVHPLVIGAVDRASSLSIRLCKEILAYHLTDEEKIQRISDGLNSDYPAHSYPITLREAQRIQLNAVALDQTINQMLLELNGLYSEMGQRAITDYDESNHHDNEILNILERNGLQVFYQTDKDWHYREQERRWISLNDESSWRRLEKINQRVVQTKLHIS